MNLTLVLLLSGGHNSLGIVEDVKFIICILPFLSLKSATMNLSKLPSDTQVSITWYIYPSIPFLDNYSF